MPRGQKAKTYNRSNIVTNPTKTFKWSTSKQSKKKKILHPKHCPRVGFPDNQLQHRSRPPPCQPKARETRAGQGM